MTQDGSQSHPVEALSAYLDQEIEGPGRAEIEAHLEACAGCRALLEDLRRLDAAVDAEVAPPVPAGLARRIRSRLGPAGVADAAPGTEADEAAARAPVPVRRRRSAWFGPLPLAAAASLLVVSALWLLAPDRSTAPSRPPAPAGDERTMARNDAAKDFAPTPPPAEIRPAAVPSPADEGKTKTSALQETMPLEKESRRQDQPRVSAPKIAASRAAPEAGAPAPSGERDRTAMRQVAESDTIAPSSRLEAGATAATASGGSAGGSGDLRAGSWPVRIEAPPYHVVLTAENEMIVSQGAWTCAVAIDAADGRRLIRMARAETALFLSAPATASAAPGGAAPPSPDGATKSAAKETAPASAGAPRPTPREAPGETEGETVAARSLSPAGETALQLIRGRYRAQIEEHCVHVLP
jgi:hypothetical protein